MTTARERGYRPWRRYLPPEREQFKPGDAVKTDVGTARRDTILASLQIVVDELKNEKLTVSELKEIRARANTLRNLLGLPSQ